VIEGHAEQLFIAAAGRVFTPDLARCGVVGAQRERVRELLRREKVHCEERDLRWTDVLAPRRSSSPTASSAFGRCARWTSASTRRADRGARARAHRARRCGGLGALPRRAPRSRCAGWRRVLRGAQSS
jgi:hypothetical protein